MNRHGDNTKRHIAARFHAAGPTYHRQPGIQPVVAGKVAEMIADSGCLDGIDCPRILEVGCGTGLLTQRLTTRFPAARILAVDVAASMIEQARERLGDPDRITWQTTDIQQLQLEQGAFDLIASSSALHWVRPLQPALEHLLPALKPNGKLVCGLMTRGTLHELRTLRREIAPGKHTAIHLPGKDQVLGAVLAAGFDLVQAREDELTARYPSAAEFLRILNRQGVTGGLYGPRQTLNRTELRRLTKEYETRCAHPEGGVTATYRVLFMEARAESPEDGNRCESTHEKQLPSPKTHISNTGRS